MCILLGSEDNLQDLVLFSMCVCVIRFRMADLVANAFTYQAILLSGK